MTPTPTPNDPAPAPDLLNEAADRLQFYIDCVSGSTLEGQVTADIVKRLRHAPPAPVPSRGADDAALAAAREMYDYDDWSEDMGEAGKESDIQTIAAIFARHIAPIVAERDRYKQALKEIAEGYANNEPTAAQWAAEALTATAGRGAT